MNHDLTLPGGQQSVLRAPAPPAWPPSGSSKAVMWRHLCCMATGMSKESDLPGSLWLGGELLFWRCPRELGGCRGMSGAGRGVLAGLQHCGHTHSAEPAKERGRGAWP